MRILIRMPRQICLLGRFAHPSRNGHSHALLEGEAEGAVAAVAAVVGQLLGGDGLPCGDCLAIETHKVVDAEVVDIGIVGHAMTGEKLAEIEAVDADSCGELLQGQVVLQV